VAVLVCGEEKDETALDDATGLGTGDVVVLSIKIVKKTFGFSNLSIIQFLCVSISFLLI
jgi:hypothetical protein